VPESERTSDKEFFTTDALSASSSTHNLPSIAQSVLGATAPRGGVSDEERLTWEEERQKLYLQLDDKVSTPTHHRCHFLTDASIEWCI